MPKGYPNSREETEIYPAATTEAIEANKPKTVAVKLLKNYRPLDIEVDPEGGVTGVDVVGYDKAPVLRKNAAGTMIEVEKGGFIRGQQPPPATPGTGFPTKVWAGTTIRLPVEEAKAVRKAGIGEYELEV